MPVRAAPLTDAATLFFPSVGEYPVLYNDEVYDALHDAGGRNARYLAAIERHSAGRDVVDIGTGRDALWAIAAARAGARRVYAIEALPEVAERARQAVSSAGFDDVVTVLTGDSRHLDPPWPATLCVSEVIGNIASAEGAVALLNDARRRLAAPACRWIPHRCDTVATAVGLHEVLPPGGYAIAEEALPYLRTVFDHAGRAFDIRLCVTGPVERAVMSSPAVVESLVFDRQLDPEAAMTAELTIDRPGRLTGLVLSIRLWCAADQDPVESLTSRERAWAPVYVPVSATGVPVAAGDRVRLRFTRTPGTDGVHPDYELAGTVVRAGGPAVDVDWRSPYDGSVFRGDDLYRHLFPED
jgi:protein arginine N-methyltransferase 1